MAQVPLANTQSLPVPLMTGGTSTTDDGNVQGGFAVNLKLRQIPTKDKPGTCTSHGGLTQWLPSSAIGESDRGGILWKDKMYRVQGSSVYAYAADGTRTLLGGVVNDGLKCRLDYSFDNLIIVSAGLLYYYAPTGYSNATGATAVSGGTGYNVGDTITIGPLGCFATLTVTAVSSGVITAVAVTTQQRVLTNFIPANPAPQVLSSGGGTGATFNIVWTSVGNFLPVNMSLSAGITPIVDACFMAGYVIVTDGVDVWVSSLVNLTFFPGYFGSAEYDPDGITAIFKLNNQLYVHGVNTTQTMANTGGNNFPFTVQQSYTFDIGCVSRQTMCYFNRSLAWIGGGRNMPNGVWMLNGNAPAKISSAAVDFELAKLSAAQVAVVTLEAISFEDSELLYVHLPDKTLVFDATATAGLGVKFWTQLNSGAEANDFYRARNFVRFNGMWACGDLADNRVGFLDSTTGGHYGAPVLHRTSSPMVMLPLASAGLRSVELKCITGQAGDTSRIAMTYSSDGIRWSQTRYTRAVTRGGYSKRIRWLPGGLTRNKMQVRIDHVTTAHVTWFGLDVELEPLAT
ncbi:DNA stabilization, phage-associated [Caballeronia glathei]|uniref:packaged DNA stabilization protein n=1 Tax=Caballeronia glathei TaxID=60547 RepID=UPI0005036D72|nr:packaged DNA stabilization protein [Caballeronia glathei]CDY76115.1 DNA stabilization, phage-associated [Caballeronia glathei]